MNNRDTNNTADLEDSVGERSADTYEFKGEGLDDKSAETRYAIFRPFFERGEIKREKILLHADKHDYCTSSPDNLSSKHKSPIVISVFSLPEGEK